MSKQRNGGPAFPRPAIIHPDSARIIVPAEEGMTLRDYFAGQALQGMLAGGVTIDIDGDYLFQNRARTVYAIADALLSIRNSDA